MNLALTLHVICKQTKKISRSKITKRMNSLPTKSIEYRMETTHAAKYSKVYKKLVCQSPTTVLLRTLITHMIFFNQGLL